MYIHKIKEKQKCSSSGSRCEEEKLLFTLKRPRVQSTGGRRTAILMPRGQGLRRPVAGQDKTLAPFKEDRIHVHAHSPLKCAILSTI